MMSDYTGYMRDFLLGEGADLVGFGDISELPADERHDMPVGIAIAIKYPRGVIRGIHDMPTPDYRAHYDSINERLDHTVQLGAQALVSLGYRAIAQTRAFVGIWEQHLATPLPHKTVATRAGLGWIGKSALFVTKTYGSALRISSILTDAPLRTATPVDESLCASCAVCAAACPAHAVKGANWFKGMPREAYFDAPACHKEARARSLQALGEDVTICGKCIEVCPYTRVYLNQPDDLIP